ncbi:hypothetical protein HPB52_010046 [Rhipicephalus sanguineus]|uniref:Uncharacterized protein n=1 Tax=Rhipicephalus sanguineus TaxID=34632 RepID=A0A9D4T620_RHISA|nr:hypothetical protein HPB52_010046 [Rhipicephalus sanguineus]
MQAQEYAEHLASQNWRSFCNHLQGTLSTKKTWHILQALIDVAHNKTQRRHTIQRLIHSYAGTEEQLLQELETKLRDSDNLQATSNNFPTSREYQGAPNEELDWPFRQAELHAALAKLTHNTSPGKYRATNKHLRQLPHWR